MYVKVSIVINMDIKGMIIGKFIFMWYRNVFDVKNWLKCKYCWVSFIFKFFFNECFYFVLVVISLKDILIWNFENR